VIEHEKHVYRAQLADEKKPEAVVEKIVEGKLVKFFAEVCLLKQPFIKDQDKSVEEMIKDRIAKTGENIILRRFARMELGE
jgi:elongation factor Ts